MLPDKEDIQRLNSMEKAVNDEFSKFSGQFETSEQSVLQLQEQV